MSEYIMFYIAIEKTNLNFEFIWPSLFTAVFIFHLVLLSSRCYPFLQVVNSLIPKMLTPSVETWPIL